MRDKMDWEELLAFLKENVPSGNVTTYGNLSEVFFGGPGAGPAIAAMLRAAVADDALNNNSTWTNRVVNARGEIHVPGQLEQLQKEGIAIRNNGTVNFHQCPPLSFDVEGEPTPPPPPEPPPPVPTTNTTAFDTFKHIINYQEFPGTEELQKILLETSYEKGSFANIIKFHLGKKFESSLNQTADDLFTLIRLAKDSGQMIDDAIDLAHTIRKQRNQIIYQNVSVETYHARNCLVLIAALLLWPQLPN
jgi:alkylated DNA nucleotide flippase Atl1